MRARWLSLGILLVAIVVGTAWLLWQRPKPQTIALPDGSQLTLLSLTSGTNNICRYGNGWKEFLYPFLPLKLRVKLSARVMEWDSFNPNGVMAWFRRDRVDYFPPPFFANAGGSPTMRLYLCAADEDHLESCLQLTAQTAREIRSTRVLAGPGTTGIQISGWELADYPKRSRLFKIVVYCQTENTLSPLGLPSPNASPIESTETRSCFDFPGNDLFYTNSCRLCVKVSLWRIKVDEAVRAKAEKLFGRSSVRTTFCRICDKRLSWLIGG